MRFVVIATHPLICVHTFVLMRFRLSLLHPRRPRGSQSGGRKGATKVFKHRRKSPWVTDSHRTISKRSSECWLLIGHKKCFVLLCPIGDSFSWVLFVRSYMTAIDWITACLALAPKKCTQSGKFQFDINPPFQNTVYPKTKGAFPKIGFSLQQVFTLSSITPS